MSNHPVFSPRLSRSNVQTLLRSLKAERETPYLKHSEYNDGFIDGLMFAEMQIEMMWESAVMSAAAVAVEFDPPAPTRAKRCVDAVTFHLRRLIHGRGGHGDSPD